MFRFATVLLCLLPVLTGKIVYRYVCILHLNLGMEALIVVGPSSGAAALLLASAGMLVSAVLFLFAL